MKTVFLLSIFNQEEQSNAEVLNIMKNVLQNTTEIEKHEESSTEAVNGIDSSKTGFIQVEINIKDKEEVTATEEHEVVAVEAFTA